jgi:hypothetical protein
VRFSALRVTIGGGFESPCGKSMRTSTGGTFSLLYSSINKIIEIYLK